MYVLSFRKGCFMTAQTEYAKLYAEKFTIALLF